MTLAFGRNALRAVAVLGVVLVGCGGRATRALAAGAGPVPAGAAGRVVVLVPVSAEAGWGEMAYLAAVPAGMVATGGEPAVVAWPADGAVGPEVRDYLRRYKPQRVYTVGGGAGPTKTGVSKPAGTTGTWRRLAGGSADAAACALSRTFWKSSRRAVLCGRDDYASGLLASSLAGRLGVPLLFCGADGPSAATRRELSRLGVGRAIVVGRSDLSVRGVEVTRLADAKSALRWMRRNGHSVRYVAAVNPADRTDTVIKKLSLAGPLLAAARGGVTIPLTYKTRWKTPFTGKPFKTEPPKGVTLKRRSKKDLPRKGVIELDGREYGFVVTVKPYRLYVDLDGDGAFDREGEGPLKVGEVVSLGGRSHAVVMGPRNGVGKADVRLIWPTAQKVCEDLKAHYAAAGSPPEHLCLVGFPDALPQAVVPREPAGRFADVLTDYPYANADADAFAEIALARLIGESASLTTLYASRAVTYDRLLDASWQDSVGQARWENTYWPLFENYGFTRQFHHDVADLKWLVKPTEGERGKRAREFDRTSPLTSVAAITHCCHSNWKALGQTYSWDSTVLLAPALVESAGCLTAALDHDGAYRSVIARFLRNGAVGFVGNGRPGIGAQEHMRLAFWNGVLAGETIGQAHRRSQNSMCLEVMDRGQMEKGGSMHYTLSIRTLFGDPAFRMRVPAKPKAAPAHVTVKGDTVTVHGPGAWWPVSIRIPEDWKMWTGKKLYVCRAAGTYVSRNWCGGKYGRERNCTNAEIRTARRIKSIKQIQTPPKPLGWSGKYWTDEHADGTRTYRWRVRLLDLDQTTGKITSKTDRLDYRIEWQ
ncbi:MAG: C25 family cysteine peptidase [Planctomycetota bacterium]